MDFEVVEVSENERTPRKRADTAYLQVFSLWGKYPLNWKTNRTQVQAAKNLLEEHGLEDIENALKWYRKCKSTQFCPQIHTPYDLDSKWAKLEAFVEKI